jgi:hypothetical protein
MKLSSSGVLRPKILTITFSFFFSSFTSSIIPLKLLKGPSITLHRFTYNERTSLISSPFSASSSTLPKIRLTSLGRMGIRVLLWTQKAHDSGNILQSYEESRPNQCRLNQNITREIVPLLADFLPLLTWYTFSVGISTCET